MQTIVKRLPIVGGVAAIWVTLGAIWLVIYVGHNSITDGLLAASYLFAWGFIHGDGGNSTMEYYHDGFLFGLAFNIMVGSLGGWMIRGILSLTNRSWATPHRH